MRRIVAAFKKEQILQNRKIKYYEEDICNLNEGAGYKRKGARKQRWGKQNTVDKKWTEKERKQKTECVTRVFVSVSTRMCMWRNERLAFAQISDISLNIESDHFQYRYLKGGIDAERIVSERFASSCCAFQQIPVYCQSAASPKRPHAHKKLLFLFSNYTKTTTK